MTNLWKRTARAWIARAHGHGSIKRAYLILLIVVAVALVSAAAVALAGMKSLPRYEHERPRTLEENIARIQAITYEDIAPYLEARFVFRADGHAWHCTEDNFDKLPDRPMWVWIARETTRKYVFSRPENLHFCYWDIGPRTVGDSPWGVFTTFPELRKFVEPIFEQTKQEYIDILRKQERQREEGESMHDGPAGSMPEP